MRHDFDLPGGFQDADLEAAALNEAANRETRLKRRGICAHGWLQGPPGPKHAPTKVCTCLDCGKTWATTDEAHEERRLILE